MNLKSLSNTELLNGDNINIMGQAWEWNWIIYVRYVYSISHTSINVTSLTHQQISPPAMVPPIFPHMKYCAHHFKALTQWACLQADTISAPASVPVLCHSWHRGWTRQSKASALGWPRSHPAQQADHHPATTWKWTHWSCLHAETSHSGQRDMAHWAERTERVVLSPKLGAFTKRQGNGCCLPHPAPGTRPELHKGIPQAEAKEAIFREVPWTLRQPCLWCWVGQTVSHNGQEGINYLWRKMRLGFESPWWQSLEQCASILPTGLESTAGSGPWLPRRRRR